LLAEQAGEKTLQGIGEDKQENKQSQERGKQEEIKGETINN
jgi:hypothetical protein